MSHTTCAGSPCSGCAGRNCMNNTIFDDMASTCGSGQAYCCDMMGRVKQVGAWEDSTWYPTHSVVFSIKGGCKGCPLDAQYGHTSMGYDFWNPGDNQPCYTWPVGDWQNEWHYCSFRVGVGCVNANSYLGGSPNGTCLENCIQTRNPYLTDPSNFPPSVHGDLDPTIQGNSNNWYGSDQEHSNFDDTANFDCEPPQSDADGSQTANSGPKMIHVNISVIDNWTNSTNATIDPWRRKGPETAARGSNGWDACCTYVSFGCPDPAFGSYNPGAHLDCAGNYISSENYLNQPNNTVAGGNIVASDAQYNPAAGVNNPNPNYGIWAVQPGTQFDNNAANSNWKPDIDCTRCYDDTVSPPVPCSGPGDPNCANSPTNPGCTAQIWDACGMGGTFTDSWGLQGAMCATSSIFNGNGEGTGTFGSPGSLGNAPCVCNNSGCMDSSQINFTFANNYSPINTQDCAGVPQVPPNVGDSSCCEWVVYGCTDPTAVVNGNNNYFCCDPSNYIYCSNNPADLWNNGAGYGTNAGNCTTAVAVANVTLVDDGSCDLNITLGCMDDGGVAAGGSWPSPLFPGYPATNYDPTLLVTVHDQTLCVYTFGCIDPLADNYLIDENGLPFVLTDPIIPSATVCDYSIVGVGPGCTDPMALNYNPLADPDDGSCIYPTEGCTDPNAINFNPLAVVDDGSCEYITDYPEVGTNFLDGTPMELCMEPLTKEEALINVCQPTEIQSDVFIERGKQSVLSPNQRLGEVKTIGGLQNYGYGYYNIKNEG